MKMRNAKNPEMRRAADIVKPVERLSAKIGRDMSAIEAEERQREAKRGHFAPGLFQGVSWFGCDGK